MPKDSPRAERDDFFLPDFCAIPTVFAVVLGGELLAFLLVLAQSEGLRISWIALAHASLFVQWVGLTSAAVLCMGRPWLGALRNPVAGTVSYGVVLLVTALLSEATLWLMERQHVAMSVAADRQTGFLLRNLAISAIVSAVALRYSYIHFQWKARMESEARARIQALQSRIRPHFLFNSMNTIASLTRTQPDLAEEAVEDLAELFRATLGDARLSVSLAEECALCRHYLRIEQHRMGERLRVEWALHNLPDDARLPALTLQPLVENAVYHGVESMPEGGVVRIEGERTGGELRIAVSNSIPVDAGQPLRDGNRMAQENIRQRLDAFFGGRSTFLAQAEAGEYRVRLSFPYVAE